MIIRDGSYDDNNPIFAWNNLVTVDNVEASNQDDNFPDDNLANPATHLKWRMDGDHSDEYLTVFLDGQTVDYLAVAQHNFGDEGVSCSIETDTGSGWNEVLAPTLITDNRPIIFQFEPDNLVGIRLRMQGTDIFCEAAVLYTGEILTMERSVRIDVNHTPINFGTISNVVNGMSESGQFLGRLVKNQYQDSKIDFYFLVDDFYIYGMDPFIRSAVDKPFFMAWSPDGHPNDVGYCWLTKDPRPDIHLMTDRYNVSLEMRGLA